MERSERELIEDALHGDTAAFAALIHPHDHSIRGAAYNVILDPNAVDDVVQETYLRAFRHLAQFRGDAPFAAWLHGIAYRSAIDHLRRRRTASMLDGIEVVDHEPGPEARAVGDDLVGRALAALAPDQRAVIVLVDQLGLPYDQVAAVLGVEPGTVGSRATRARARLRTVLTSAQHDTERPDDRKDLR